MDQVEERLIEEVRKYDHLYNSSSAHYKDCQMANNSWKEIAQSVGLDVTDCIKRWKYKFDSLRKKVAPRNGDPGGKKVPAFYHFLSWLAPHIKHRETESNFEPKEQTSPPSDFSMPSTSSSELSSVSPQPPSSPVQPLSVSTQPPPVPAVCSLQSSNPAESPVSRGGFKRKRNQEDWLMKQMTQLEERRMDLQQKLVQERRVQPIWPDSG
ncbi:hypothetical protein DPEC_G00342430 [Dallia pectoralis]|uniref:Uncharacterized protein n=1 Tax=Dallia pectoralis TaxID=75939 RepID=A0ACC2F5N6_DALPE|nr:hypothetical protein DPEC_G00342430 [Dallia pectoralis]